MKRLLLIVPIVAMMMASCGSNDTSLDEVLEDINDIDNAANSFAEGNAKNGEEYFSGLLAEVIAVDVKYREMEELDMQDASEKEISSVLDTCLVLIKDARKALNLYKDKDWPKRAEFHDLTMEWFAGIENMVKKYAKPLAGAMAKPDEEWTDDEFDLYDEWQEDYDAFLDLDNRWVEFQHEYAEANGFMLSTETIDVDALVEEDMGK